MGTGLLAPFYRVAVAPLYDAAQKKAGEKKLVIQEEYGVLQPPTKLTDAETAIKPSCAFRDCSRRGLSYPGGNYLEFGSYGLSTFRSFLGAFSIYHVHTKHFPTRLLRIRHIRQS
jgi:hypothetical protein